MTKETKTYNGVKTVYSINGIGKTGENKSETGPLSYVT